MTSSKLNHRVTHNCSEHELYGIWNTMMHRCYNASCKKYEIYGGRGIKVCLDWHCPAKFISQVEELLGTRPPKHQLDRRDNDGDYTPSNVRWATTTQQARNRRSNTMLTINGATKCLQDWADEYGINKNTLRERIKRGKLGSELLLPVRNR